MDVTFHESEPFYDEKTDLSILFEDLDQFPDAEIGQERESSQQPPQSIVGLIPVVPAPPPHNSHYNKCQRGLRRETSGCMNGEGGVSNLLRGSKTIRFRGSSKDSR